MTAEHREYLEKNHPDIWNNRPCPKPGFILIEIGIEDKGGIVTPENPKGEKSRLMNGRDKVLVGEGEFFKAGDIVRCTHFIDRKVIYSHLITRGPKGQDITTENEDFIPPISFEKTEKRGYVVWVPAEAVNFKYES